MSHFFNNRFERTSRESQMIISVFMYWNISFHYLNSTVACSCKLLSDHPHGPSEWSLFFKFPHEFLKHDPMTLTGLFRLCMFVFARRTPLSALGTHVVRIVDWCVFSGFRVNHQLIKTKKEQKPKEWARIFDCWMWDCNQENLTQMARVAAVHGSSQQHWGTTVHLHRRLWS